MGGKHLERRHEMGQRHRWVGKPLLVVVDIVDKDNKALVVALEVDLGLDNFAASHDE